MTITIKRKRKQQKTTDKRTDKRKDKKRTEKDRKEKGKKRKGKKRKKERKQGTFRECASSQNDFKESTTSAGQQVLPFKRR